MYFCLKNTPGDEETTEKKPAPMGRKKNKSKKTTKKKKNANQVCLRKKDFASNISIGLFMFTL